MNHAIELSVLSPMASVESMLEAFGSVQQNGFATLTVPPFWVKNYSAIGLNPPKLFYRP